MAKYSKVILARIETRLNQMRGYSARELETYVFKTMFARQGHASDLEIDREALKALMVERGLKVLEKPARGEKASVSVTLTPREGTKRPDWEAIAKHLAGEAGIPQELLERFSKKTADSMVLSAIK